MKDQELKDHKVIKEMMDIKDLLVIEAQMVTRDQREIQEMLDLMDIKAPKVMMARKDLQE